MVGCEGHENSPKRVSRWSVGYRDSCVRQRVWRKGAGVARGNNGGAQLEAVGRGDERIRIDVRERSPDESTVVEPAFALGLLVVALGEGVPKSQGLVTSAGDDRLPVGTHR